MLKVANENSKFLCENYMKIYPKKVVIYKYHRPFLKLKDGLEPDLEFKEFDVKATGLGSEESKLRSINRTRTTISDIVLCNNFDLFATFTFATDRQNIEGKKNQMRNWLKSQQKLHGSFKYIIVPEYHKDKQSIHFHAIMGGFKGKLVESGVNINGRKGFNFSGYRSGFNSAVYIDNVDKVSSYVKKYITKEMIDIFGKKRYWTSKGLIRPILNYNTTLLEHKETQAKAVWANEFFTVYELHDIVTTETF